MDRMRRRFRRLALAALAPAVAMACTLALLPDLGSTQEAAKKAPEAPVAAQPKVVMPDAEKIVLLLRTTLLTLNDALQTGNFTVLRDVAAPDFREANTAARLSEIFGNIPKQGIELTMVALLVPQISEPPAIDPKTSMLRLKGHFPGQPVRLDFEMLYQPVAGRWRLYGLSVRPTVSTLPPTAVVAPPADKPAPKKAEPAQK
jgi:hypothetical protein